MLVQQNLIMNIANTKHIVNSALIGMILADGTVLKNKYLILRHGGKQLEYVNEKVQYLSKYCNNSEIKTSLDKAGYTYRYTYIKYKTIPYLSSKIYINGKKSISKIINRITDVSLAFIYMDDGCLSLRKSKTGDCYSSREIHLNVQSFTFNEVKLLQEYILKKWDVDFHITIDKGKPRLWCNTKNTIKFLRIVYPIVKNFKTMHYKLDLKYKNKIISL